MDGCDALVELIKGSQNHTFILLKRSFTVGKGARQQFFALPSGCGKCVDSRSTVLQRGMYRSLAMR